ncbi:hypothetical protein [Halomonas organivorans]|uniref:Uncharacterized protein n=1 Tax=Halomonas organivorans TaxID=257772 RepID=A0A7W5BW92_9GAMM|nr:hypothetical protein [Halomonas organivorans]MBB3139989.1 hypothetical protein [Halomonas organivorans]
MRNTDASSPTCPRRRRLLAALGLVGMAAYAAPTLTSVGQSHAGGWDDGRWRIVYESEPRARERRYVDDYREHRRHRDHHRRRHHHKHHHHHHSWSRHSRPSFSHPSRW